jgi:hypothetical protein
MSRRSGCPRYSGPCCARIPVRHHQRENNAMSDSRRLFQIYILRQMRFRVGVERAMSLLGASSDDFAIAQDYMARAGFERPTVTIGVRSGSIPMGYGVVYRTNPRRGRECRCGHLAARDFVKYAANADYDAHRNPRQGAAAARTPTCVRNGIPTSTSGWHQEASVQDGTLRLECAKQITRATAGQWSAAEVSATNGTIFAGEGGEALVFDSAGNIFRGSLADRAAFAFGQGGAITIAYELLRRLQ